MTVELRKTGLQNLAFDDTFEATVQKHQTFLQLQVDKEVELKAIGAIETKAGSSMIRLRGVPSRDAFDLSCDANCVIGAPALLTKKGEGVLYFEVESLTASGQCSCAHFLEPPAHWALLIVAAPASAHRWVCAGKLRWRHGRLSERCNWQQWTPYYEFGC